MELFFNKNAVVSYDNQITKISGFHGDRVKLVCFKELIDIKDIKPVKITNEFIKYHGLSGIIDIETILDEVRYSIYIRGLRIVTVEYIHEIQNIFTALFKEELTIDWTVVHLWWN